MQTEPTIEQRDPRPCVAIPATVTMDSIGSVMPPLLDEVFEWLRQQGAEPAGPPFFRYVVFDMAGELEMEAGVPVKAPLAGNGRVQPGEIPAGRYATVLHTGPYERLVDTTRDLLAWADENGVRWQAHGTGNREAWAGRFEFYLTDPAEEPDPAKWETELAFLVADGEAAG